MPQFADAFVPGQLDPVRADSDGEQIAEHPAQKRQEELQTAQQQLFGRLAVQRLQDQRADAKRCGKGEIALVNRHGRDKKRNSKCRAVPEPHGAVCSGAGQRQCEEVSVCGKHVGHCRCNGRECDHHRRSQYTESRAPDAEQLDGKTGCRSQPADGKQTIQPRRAERAARVQDKRQQPTPRFRAVRAAEQMTDVVMVRQFVDQHIEMRQEAGKQRRAERHPEMARNGLPGKCSENRLSARSI